jgi:hypothetical protein
VAIAGSSYKKSPRKQGLFEMGEWKAYAAFLEPDFSDFAALGWSSIVLAISLRAVATRLLMISLASRPDLLTISLTSRMPLTVFSYERRGAVQSSACFQL